MKTMYYWIGICSILLSISPINAQVKNKITETFYVSGNCSMCKTTIEKAGNKKSEAQVTWDESSKSASINYDSTKTTSDAILKRIALAGYDNEKFLAPDETYAQLHGCCQYERSLKGKDLMPTHTEHKQHSNTSSPDLNSNKGVESIVSTYLSIKDALVNSDPKEASKQAKVLQAAVVNLETASLSSIGKQTWIDNSAAIRELAEKIGTSNSVDIQRGLFGSLATNIYTLVKATPLSYPIYYQNCPMFNNGKGANWLSLNQEIKNPFYGSKMMTCGNTKEIIE